MWSWTTIRAVKRMVVVDGGGSIENRRWCCRDQSRWTAQHCQVEVVPDCPSIVHDRPPAGTTTVELFPDNGIYTGLWQL